MNPFKLHSTPSYHASHNGQTLYTITLHQEHTSHVKTP